MRFTWPITMSAAPFSDPSMAMRCIRVIEACVAGLGICQLPEFYVLPYLRYGMVKLLLEDVRPKDEPIWAVYPRRRHLLPKIHAAIEALNWNSDQCFIPITGMTRIWDGRNNARRWFRLC